MAVGTTGAFIYDDSISFATAKQGEAELITVIFKHETQLASGSTIVITLPEFTGTTPTDAGNSCGTLAASVTFANTGAANAAVTFTLTGELSARTECKFIIGGLTLPTSVKPEDDPGYTIAVSTGTYAVSTTEPITGKAKTALSDDSLTFSTHAVNSPVEITYSFKYPQAFVASTDTVKLALPYFTGSSPVSTSLCGQTTWTLAIANANAANAELTMTAATQTLLSDISCTIVITGLSTPGLVAGVYNNFAANHRKLTSTYTFAAAATHGTLDVVIKSSDSIGVPSLYSIKSECRTGGVSSGSIQNCDVTTSCLVCSNGGNGFVQTYGTSCKTSGKVRCNARVSAQTSVDIYLNPNGVPGTVTCGAFVEDGTVGVWNEATDPVPPADHISGLSTGTSADSLYSRNSAVVSSANTANDHVVTLNRLKPDTLYHVYCHGDDFKLSEFLDVHTLPNTFISGISLAVATLTGGQPPGTLTLKLTHGAKLASTNTITMVVAPYKIFSASATDAVCSATSAGTSIALTSATGEDSTLTVTLGADSAAGSELVITCTGSLEANAAAGGAVRIKTLAATDHETVYRVSGYTTT